MESFEVFLISFVLFLATFSGLFIMGLFFEPLITIKTLLATCLTLALIATVIFNLEKFKFLFKKLKRS